MGPIVPNRSLEGLSPKLKKNRNDFVELNGIEPSASSNSRSFHAKRLCSPSSGEPEH